MKKIISWVNAAVFTIIVLYFAGSLLAWNFDPTTWWVYTSIGGRIFFGLLLGIFGYSMHISSNDPKVKEKVELATVGGHILAFVMQVMFILIAQHVILTYFIK